MKRTLAIALVMLMVSSSAVFAASASSPLYTMKASVKDEITIGVKWFDTNGDPENEISGTIIDYGDLVFDDVNVVLNNAKAKLALITMNNHKRSYVVTMTGTSLTKGSDKIPDANYQVTPVYVASDNGGVTEGTAGSAGDVAVTNKTIYTRGTHALRVARAYFGILNAPADLPVGTYQGTVQFTIADL